MVRLGEVIIAYFLIGSLMWAGGLIAWGDAGVGSVFMNPTGDTVAANQSTGEQVEQAGGPIQQAVDTVSGGGLLAVWNLVTSILTFFFWPIAVLQTVHAPAELVVLAGGVFVVAFFVGLMRLVRAGA